MIHVITGERGQGKTMEIRKIYGEMEKGEGIVMPKIIKDGEFQGYEALRLSSGEKTTLALRHNLVPPDWIEACTVGDFSFSTSALNFANQVMHDAATAENSPFFLDEVGKLETRGEGLSPSLQEILQSGSDVYITVRQRYLKQILKHFQIDQYILLEI